MFGYIVVNKDELKFREFDEYSAYYCGVCSALKNKYGLKGQISLNYDAAFLTLILSDLYDEKKCIKCRRCIVHPLKKRNFNTNVYSEYAADMSLYLTYYKCMDDWQDDKKYGRYIYAKSLKKHIVRIEEQYPEKCRAIKSYLTELSGQEKNGVSNIDTVSGSFGKIMEEIYAYKNDTWENTLRKIGFFMGKFIYLIDAYEDVFEDIKKNEYNVLAGVYNRISENAPSIDDADKIFAEECKRLLLMMMSECTREIEKLPLVENVGIIRNIIYSGVWIKYNSITQNRIKKAEKGKQYK